jgi:hypothetical protein
MDNTDEQTRNDVAKILRKVYRKPSIQVYGTLAQITENRSGQPSAFRADPAAPPSSGRRT